MKKSLKLLVLPTAMILLAGNMTSCAPSQKEIAMISDVGDIDDGSFNQGCWEAIQKYGKDNNKSYDYYRPFSDSDFARDCAVKQAVIKGAKVIIMPGFKFGDCSVKNAKLYPDVKFVLADQSLGDDIPKNLICVTYDFECSGWLAGYAVAKDYFLTDLANNKKLNDQYGFAYYGGMPFNSVYPYGLGYAEGILYAAKETVDEEGIVDPSKMPTIDIDHSYAGVFIQDDMACATAKGWLSRNERNMKCIFSCGGKLFQSVTEAVKHYNQHTLPEKERNFKDQEAPRDAARWIGVDADQYNLVQDLDDKKSVYTSALKDIGHTIKVALDYHYNNEWDILREEMDKQVNPGGVKGFVLGLNSRFVNAVTKSEKSGDRYDYVGIPEATKPNSDVLVSFNHVTLSLLKNKIAKIDRKGQSSDYIEIYHGKTPEFGESGGDLTVINSDSFKKKAYNIVKDRMSGREPTEAECLAGKYQGKVEIK